MWEKLKVRGARERGDQLGRRGEAKGRDKSKGCCKRGENFDICLPALCQTVKNYDIISFCILWFAEHY